MADSNATTTRSITVDLPDFPAGSVVFTLVTQFAADGTEGFPIKEYTLTLDASGTGTQVLPVPSTDAWSWRIKTPDTYVYQATLGAGSALALTAWLAAEATTVTAATLSSLYLPLAGGTMTGTLDLGANEIQNYSEENNTASGTSYAVDFTINGLHEFTMTGNATITFSNLAAGKSLSLMLVQGGVGSFIVSSWPTVTWTGGDIEPTLGATTPGAFDLITLFVRADGSTVVGSYRGASE